MEAKEKAKELVNKYCYALRTEETESGYFTNVIYAKEYALIAVYEIIEIISMCIPYLHESTYYEYWLEVKKEIIKL